MVSIDKKSLMIQQRHSERLFELAKILGQQNDFQEVLRLVSLKISNLFDAEIASIIMINPDTQNTIKTIIREEEEISKKNYQSVQTNVVGWVGKNKQPFLSNEVKTDSHFRKNLLKDSIVCTVMCVPLFSEGNSIGFLFVCNIKNGKRYDLKDLSLLEKFAAITAPFLSNVQKIQEYFNTPLPEAAILSKYEELGLLGKSPQFIELLRAIEAAACCDVRVLLEGKSGTGKELIARAIHQFSPRKHYPFIAIDCGTIPENLIESELFGHVKGAFTGAAKDRKGLFEEANQGTLFMDEITNLPQNMQAKLLRVLQESEIRPLGSNQSRKVDVRIIVASSAPLRNLVDQQLFREDLYYRLHVYPIHIPTLNDRREDIPLLARHFLKKFARQQNKQLGSISKPVLNFLRNRNWTGNIRELENFIERMVTLTPAGNTSLDSKIIPQEFKKEFKTYSGINDEYTIQKSLLENIADYEKQLIRQALVDSDWNQSLAARELKVSERTVRYKMEKLGIQKSG